MIYADENGNRFEQTGVGSGVDENGVYCDFIIISELGSCGIKKPEKPKSIFDLKSGDEFWVIQHGLVCCLTNIHNYEDEILAGDIFLTEEEAQKELNKRQAIMRIKKYIWENDIYSTDSNDRCVLMVCDGDVRFHTLELNEKYYSPIGEVCFNQRLLKDCKEDLLIIFDKQ